MLERVPHQIGDGLEPELFADAGPVGAHGLRCHVESVRDLAGGKAPARELEDLVLAICELLVGFPAAANLLDEPVRDLLRQVAVSGGDPSDGPDQLIRRMISGDVAVGSGPNEPHAESFVRKAGDGYILRTAGTRIIEAVLSGAVTDAPVLERTRLDAPCPYCGADVEVSYREERLLTRCTECQGSFAGSADSSIPPGIIALFDLPPVGLEDRSPEEILETAFRWTHLEYLTLAAGICPRCSGTVEHSVTVCGNHDVSEGLCEHCTGRFAVDATVTCSRCPRYLRGVPSVFLISKTEVSRFLSDHGINPTNPSWDTAPPVVLNYEEEVLTTDPLEMRVTFTIEGDELTAVADDTLSIIETDRRDTGSER